MKFESRPRGRTGGVLLAPRRRLFSLLLLGRLCSRLLLLRLLFGRGFLRLLSGRGFRLPLRGVGVGIFFFGSLWTF
jgi:hypothetical protein